jgi:hypothetical protein
VYTLVKIMARGILHRGAGGLLLLAAIPLLLLAGVAGQQCGTLYEVGSTCPAIFGRHPEERGLEGNHESVMHAFAC